MGITVLYRVEERDREVFTMCGYFLKIAEALHWLNRNIPKALTVSRSEQSSHLKFNDQAQAKQQQKVKTLNILIALSWLNTLKSACKQVSWCFMPSQLVRLQKSSCHPDQILVWYSYEAISGNWTKCLLNIYHGNQIPLKVKVIIACPLHFPYGFVHSRQRSVNKKLFWWSPPLSCRDSTIVVFPLYQFHHSYLFLPTNSIGFLFLLTSSTVALFFSLPIP